MRIFLGRESHKENWKRRRRCSYPSASPSWNLTKRIERFFLPVSKANPHAGESHKENWKHSPQRMMRRCNRSESHKENWKCPARRPSSAPSAQRESHKENWKASTFASQKRSPPTRNLTKRIESRSLRWPPSRWHAHNESHKENWKSDLLNVEGNNPGGGISQRELKVNVLPICFVNG